MNKIWFRFDMIGAYESGKTEHPQLVIKELSNKLNFKVIKYYPVSIADCWLCWAETKEILTKNDFPNYITLFDDREYQSFEDWNKA